MEDERNKYQDLCRAILNLYYNANTSKERFKAQTRLRYLDELHSSFDEYWMIRFKVIDAKEHFSQVIERIEKDMPSNWRDVLEDTAHRRLLMLDFDKFYYERMRITEGMVTLKEIKKAYDRWAIAKAKDGAHQAERIDMKDLEYLCNKRLGRSDTREYRCYRIFLEEEDVEEFDKTQG